jgi:hypothetical protein
MSFNFNSSTDEVKSYTSPVPVDPEGGQVIVNVKVNSTDPGFLLFQFSSGAFGFEVLPNVTNKVFLIQVHLSDE